MKESEGQSSTMTALALSPIFDLAFVKTECGVHEEEEEATDDVDKGGNTLPTILDGELFRVLTQDGDRISAQCCQCPPYKKPIRGTRLSTGNFLSHLLRVHPDSKSRVQEKRKEKRGMKRQFPDHPDLQEQIKSQLYPLCKSFKIHNQQIQCVPNRSSITLTPLKSNQNVSIPPQDVDARPSLTTDPMGSELCPNQNAISIVPLHSLSTKPNPKSSEAANVPESSRETSQSFLRRKTSSDEVIVKAADERAKAEEAITVALVRRAKAEEAIALALERRAKAELAMAVVLERRVMIEENMVVALERNN